MRQYFKEMSLIGKKLADDQKKKEESNALEIAKIEEEITQAVERRNRIGLSPESLHQRGEKTALERIKLLVDPDTFLPLNSLYDPEFNQEGTTGVITGLGKISGRYASIIASDNKVLAGAWIPGQREHIFRAQDIAECLNIPLVWVLNCSGVKLTEQEQVYAGRRSGGRAFFKHAEMQQKGIEVICAMFGTNPAGGGYHAISPSTILPISVF